MRAVSRLASVAMLLVPLLAACASSPEPQQTSLVGAGSLPTAMRGAKTVSFHPRARLVRPRPGESTSSLRRATERALVDAFVSRGYTVVPYDGDRQLAYAVGISDSLADEELVMLFGISPGLDTGDGSHRGGLVLALWDPRLRDVVWRRSASVEVPGREPKPSERQARIEDGVAQLLSDLPPGPGR